MNERIHLLAEQATRKYDRLGNNIPFAQPDLELFARLIIHECAEVALESSHREDDMAAIVVRKINKHFGVEL